MNRCDIHGPECYDATVHHFLKYHDPKSPDYIGCRCVNCAFGRVERERHESSPYGVDKITPEQRIRAVALVRALTGSDALSGTAHIAVANLFDYAAEIIALRDHRNSLLEQIEENGG